jgi:hypothetical protein
MNKIGLEQYEAASIYACQITTYAPKRIPFFESAIFKGVSNYLFL